jgi:energy-coupling factor transport system ATP-binding protein
MSIIIENLTHIFLQGTSCEKTALRNISLELETGLRIGIAGTAGSGKTTLIQHLNGLLKPSGGTISVNGLDVTPRNLKELRKRVGVVFQHPEQQLFEETVFKEVVFGLSGAGITSSEKEMRVMDALRAVGLAEELREISPFALSCGEKRRVAIAGVLAMRPEVLVLDEPTSGLDPQGRREILLLLEALHRECGITLVIVSHNMDDLARLCDRVVVLQDGAVALDGNAGEVLSDIKALEAAGLKAPQISYLMMRMKGLMPEIEGSFLTVEEARDELMRIWKSKRSGKGLSNERNDHGSLFPRGFDYSPIGSEDKNHSGNDYYGGCLSA